MPRFSYSTQLDLCGLWQAAGVRHVFDPDHADLTGMAVAKCRISQVLHEATIEVNEIVSLFPRKLVHRRLVIPTHL